MSVLLLALNTPTYRSMFTMMLTLFARAEPARLQCAVPCILSCLH